MGLIGEFPRGIQNCTSLTSLNLSNNELYGTIPSDISKLIVYAVIVDLSSNLFSGAIPSDISNFSFLNSLKLENNKLEGLIPPEIRLLQRLKTFNVANNMLTGPVPNFVNATFPDESYANNPGLCGSPLELCVTERVVSRHILFACGFVTGWSLSTLLGVYLFFFGVKKMLLLINKRTKDLEEEFVSEITTLGILRHPNLVPLIGFCYERDKRLLVYKYMPNGNLHEWLHSTDDKARLLDFPLRVKIVVGVAKALAWLHDGGNFDPKLSNFWEATFVEPNDIGSNLSLSPMVEFLDFTTYKKDVYKFGVVLLEILTGKESYELSCSSLNLSSSSFASPLDVDKLLLGQGFDNMVMQLLELASNCMKFIPDQRPTMQQVYQIVAAIARVHDQTGDSEIQLHLD
uniref:Serine-threonine protein kinase, plant-type n=1 Tax=Solanum tuberosum TaxID=4113 RepID=M1CMI0_SOLTU